MPFIVEKQFVSRGFAWRVLDKRLLMYESSKRHGSRLQTKVCSHCSVFDQIYTPALKRFYAFLKDTGRANYSLFIYDGDLLPQHQLEDSLVARMSRNHPASSGNSSSDRFRLHYVGSGMNLTQLDVSLEQYEVGLSGAVPDRKDWSEPAMDRGVLEFVALFSGLVLSMAGESCMAVTRRSPQSFSDRPGSMPASACASPSHS